MGTYVISDIHGRLIEFEQMLHKINFDENQDKLFILGDYVDWGPDSIKVLKRCIELSQYDSVKCLMGNHDKMMLDVIKTADYSSDFNEYYRCCESEYYHGWAMNGGDETLLQYCNTTNKAEKMQIVNWLENLEYTITDLKVGNKQFYLCHASPQFKNMTPYDVIWNRLDPNSRYVINKIKDIMGDTIVIFGHTIVKRFGSFDSNGKCKIFKNETGNIIGIDCGAKVIGYFDYGRLACIRLEDMMEFYV